MSLITLALVGLVLSQVFYALLPYRRRSYPAVLATCAAGMVLGQVWLVLGLPAWSLGEADLVPAAAFALLLQPLAGRIPIRWGRTR